MKLENGKLQSSGLNLYTYPSSSQQDAALKKIQGRYSPVSIFLITIIGIAVAEIIAMIVVYYQRELPYYQQVIIDATVMTVIIFPILYFLSFRPILRHIQQRYQVEQVLKSRLRIIEHSNTHSLDEILQFTLDELESLTSSKVGYFHFIDSDQTTLKSQTWSTNTLQNMCEVEGTDKHNPVDQAGVWADCIRQRQVVVHNNYTSLPYVKGLPEGHVHLTREMAAPIFRDRKIVAVLGVGNKPHPYTANDIELVSTLADFTWDIIQNKKAEAELRQLSSVTEQTADTVLITDRDGKIEYVNTAFEQLTGYTRDEALGKTPRLIKSGAHDDEFYRGLWDTILNGNVFQSEIVNRKKNGEIFHEVKTITPLRDAQGHVLHFVATGKDITERKRIEAEIEERNEKEKVLTQTIHTMQLDIARDLHDTLGQNVGFLRMKLEHLSESNSLKNIDLKTELQTMTRAANESYDLIRGTLAVLQSNDSADLFRIFSRYAEQIEKRSTIQVSFSYDGSPQSLSPKRMRQLFYIFKEALTNIEKHAQADQVSISINWNEDCLGLVVSDNGKGFDPLNTQYGSHYGLKFMRERAELLNGSLNLYSSIGTGTKIDIRIPYE